MTTTFPTCQRVSIDSKEGRTFLRKIIRDNGGFRDDGWRAYASASTDWCVEFRRTISGAIGEPDQDVLVTTDCKVRHSGKTGLIQSFTDSTPVMVATVRAIHLSGSSCSLFADMLMRGFTPQIESSSGSTKSSEYGLAFYELALIHPDHPYCGLSIGGATTKDGDCIACGCMSF